MNQYQSLAPWRGCKNVMFGYYNDYADPDLLYKGYVFNYYDVEDELPTDISMAIQRAGTTKCKPLSKGA